MGQIVRISSTIRRALRDPQNAASRFGSILVGWSLVTVFSWVGLAQFQRVLGEVISSRFGMYGVHCNRVGTIVVILPPQPGLWNEITGSRRDYNNSAESSGATAEWLDQHHRSWSIPGCRFYVSVPSFPYRQYILYVSHWLLLLASTVLYLTWFYYRRPHSQQQMNCDEPNTLV